MQASDNEHADKHMKVQNQATAAIKILYLFPDTNLFIQCRTFSELSWSDLGSYDEIHLIVSRPVQRELDNQKKRGNDRIGRRARLANKMFREILLNDDDWKVIHEGEVIVKLFLATSYKPDPSLTDKLDYQKPDDELVGCLSSCQKESPNDEFCLFTHDTGPMATAKSLKLSFIPIPDEWLLEPEDSKQEREIKVVKTELERLKKKEPLFHIASFDEKDKSIDKLEFKYQVFEALSADEVNELMKEIESNFPPATDFGPREPRERKASGAQFSLYTTREVSQPASDEEIENYQNKEYPSWIIECRQSLENIHNVLQQKADRPRFTFSVINEGTRPANDALVKIIARGEFQICPPKINDEEEADDEINVELPFPPSPPKGKWKSVKNSFGGLDIFRESLRLGGVGNELVNIGHIYDPSEHRRDPNAFYYKSKRPLSPVQSFSLECEQWRHGSTEELFGGEIYFDYENSLIKGAIEFQLHAENLSEPIEKIIPIRIEVERASVVKHAKLKIKNLMAQ